MLTPRLDRIYAAFEQVIADGAITTELLPFRPYALAGLMQRACGY